MSETKEPVCPILNLNGSSAEVLLDQLADAITAVRSALTAVVETRPHGRDYPNVGFYDAMHEHSLRCKALSEIDSDLNRIRLRIMQQCSDRNKQKER